MTAERTVTYGVRVKGTNGMLGHGRAPWTRPDAEDFCARNGDCEVVRITTTIEPVGLRWEGDDDDWSLYDGQRVVAEVWVDVRIWWRRIGSADVYVEGEAPSIDEAKAAAEAAYRATWGES